VESYIQICLGYINIDINLLLEKEREIKGVRLRSEWLKPEGWINNPKLVLLDATFSD